MPEPSADHGFAYRAFISYSHRDKAWADWLHRSLETYRVPSRLVGTETAHGPIPRRLIPVFRDRDELASADSLAEKVNAALAQSENLIVICSPASAASRWVDEEVLAYKRMGRGDRVFCLIVAGEPNASDIPGREPEECFCPALRFKLDANGQPTIERTEPIAADARPGKDGKANARLRLIAGMLDVGFDALKQREQRRQVQRMTAIASLALVVMAVTIVLAIAALVSRHRAVVAQQEAVVAKQAAQRRQKQAEGLVGFMLGDLNDKLDQVHRLDIMQSVDDKALAYFDSLPAADASDAALELRVKALDKIGGVMTEARGHLDDAMKAYQSAASLAAELAHRAPNDVKRKVALGDSLNMVGVAWWDEGNLDKALKNWQSASALFQQAHAAKADDNKATGKLAGTRNNIGHVLESRGNYEGAQTEYEASLGLYQLLAAREPHDLDQQSNVAWGWNALGKLAVESGELGRALTDYLAEHRIKAKLASASPQNHVAQEDLMRSNAMLGRTLGWCGETAADLRYTQQALMQGKALLAFEPADTGWLWAYAIYNQQAGGLLRQLGRLDDAAAADTLAVQTLAALLKKDPISSDFQHYLSQAQLEDTRLLLAKGDTATAETSALTAQANIKTLRAKAPDNRDMLLLDAQASLLLGTIAAQHHDNAAAHRDWTQARDLLQPVLSKGDDPNVLAANVEALLRLDQVDAAKPVIEKLNTMGYRTPDFVALLAAMHIPYPINTAFQQRIAAVVDSDAPTATHQASLHTTPPSESH